MPLTYDSLAQLLKSETLVQHEATEKLLYPFLTGISSAKEYADILMTFYGYYFPLEKIIRSKISPQELPDIQQRNHADLIIEDLKALGRDVSSLPLCQSLPAIDTADQAFGALYVMEGSTLGGRMIRKMLLKEHGATIQPSQLNFFNGYGEETSSRWKFFLDHLNRRENGSAVIRTANETFSLFQNWIKQFLYDEQDRSK